MKSVCSCSFCTSFTICSNLLGIACELHFSENSTTDYVKVNRTQGVKMILIF